MTRKTTGTGVKRNQNNNNNNNDNNNNNNNKKKKKKKNRHSIYMCYITAIIRMIVSPCCAVLLVPSVVSSFVSIPFKGAR